MPNDSGFTTVRCSWLKLATTSKGSGIRGKEALAEKDLAAEVAASEHRDLVDPEDESGFFAERRGAAVLKHGIIRQYLQPFASKVGVAARGNRVVYLDGYAGAGIYRDGSPGSPALAAETADRISSFRNLECIYVERDHDTVVRLRRVLMGTKHRWHALEGRIEDKLDEVLEIAGDSPMFAFFDPFGLGMSLDRLSKEVLARSARLPTIGRTGPATEVLLNFSLPGLRRVAGHLNSRGSDPTYLKARATMLKRLDAVLGGEYWRDIFEQGDPDWTDQVLEEYLDRLKSAPGNWAYWALPVSNRETSKPIYHLIFLTQHADGIWQFNQALSLAQNAYRDFCLDESGELELDHDRELRWINEMVRNLRKMLRSGSLRIDVTTMEGVFGSTLGLARETHLRKALKILREEGEIEDDIKGTLWHKRVVRVSR